MRRHAGSRHRRPWIQEWRVDGVKIHHPSLRRRITRGLRAIRRRNAIEPAIGHMQTDGKLDRNWLKGALGGAMHAVLCGTGHSLYKDFPFASWG